MVPAAYRDSDGIGPGPRRDRCQTAALVATDGTIDWFCCPRFDSPSVFGALLDRRKGGSFSLAPADEAYTTRQLYFPDTAILVTRFMTESGSPCRARTRGRAAAQPAVG
ncbi:trehalase-like domain-containing protein [Streptomyces sp. NBC_00645]|uniref:trehalase-like domain-containing protein n=1 Tax=Streptomyces sp. NBC_00645 TaxID=2975795 RepID=UPI00387027F7